MDEEAGEWLRVPEIARVTDIVPVICRRLTECIGPGDRGTMLHGYLGVRLAYILVLEGLFRHGLQPDLDCIAYHRRLCEERDAALQQLGIKNPHAATLI